MGISEGLDGGGSVVDWSVGTIVWVRRRNGSWWPGRILGPNELAASNIMSPRSGTPVKLLGREDASVDWYNLEKSKRVKAFRCGEFDDCIRKAEASQGMPIKKREKYARREDAIIHALELERQHQERQPRRIGTASNYLSNTMPCTLGELCSYSPENHGGMEGERNYYKSMNFKSQLLSKKPDSFLNEEGHVYLDTQKGNLGKILSMEDDKSEAIPRMRGLQDFGLHSASSKRKLSASAAYENSHKSLPVENHTHSFPNGAHTIGNTNHVSSIKNASFKRRRSLGGVTDEFFGKRRDRRRPLVQVLKSSAKMPMYQPLQVNGDAVPNSTLGEGDQGSRTFRAKRSKCVYLPADSSNYLDHTKSLSDHLQVSPSHIAADTCIHHPGSLTEENSSGFVEADESDSTETEYLDTDMEEEATAVSDSRSSGRYAGFGGAFQVGHADDDELDDCALSSDTSQLHPHDKKSAIAADMGGSKWQLKGKLNICNLTKRPMEAMDWRDSMVTADRSNGSNESFLEAKGNIRNRGKDLNYVYDEDLLVDSDFGQKQVAGDGKRRYPLYPLTLKSSSRGKRRITSSIVNSDEDSLRLSSSMRGSARLSQVVLRQYWEQSDGYFDPIYSGHHVDGVGSMLMEVDLKVRASYHGERVPLVSLMSGLDGKAIVGHPVQIEAMEDGSSKLLVSTNVSGNKLPEYDGDTGLPPVWRTARRTAMHRIPRSHPSASVEGEAVDPSHCSDLESEPLFKKPNSSRSCHKTTQPKKGFPQTHLPVVEKKFPKKLLKKISLSSQKTRTLSSFAIEQKVSNKKVDLKINPKSSTLDSAIKPEKALQPACIPVKLVFSRILEAVSKKPANGAISFAEQKPS